MRETPEIDKVKDTLKRLAAMRDCPTAYEGERANAEAIITRLCAKHGLTLEDIFVDEPKQREFKYKNAKERRLIGQVMAHILGNRLDSAGPRYQPRNKLFVIMLSNQEYLTASEYVDHYLQAYRDQLKRMLKAFIIANDLFYTGDDVERHAPTREDYLAMKQARGMEADPLRKKLTGPEAAPCK